MKNIVTHNYAPLRSTFVRCCISEVVGVDVKQRAPQQNSKIQYVTCYGVLYGVLRHLQPHPHFVDRNVDRNTNIQRQTNTKCCNYDMSSN